MAILTRLDAVNEMLRMLSLAPVSSLDDTENLKSSIAQETLESSRVEILSMGWHANKVKVTLEPDVDGYIAVSSTVIEIEALKNTDDQEIPDVTVRGDRLFDITNNTEVFTKNVNAYITYDLSFEDIPVSLRRFVLAHAKRRFQMNMQGNTATDSILREELALAQIQAKKEDLKKQRFNALTGNTSVNDVVNRRINPRARY